MANTVTGPLMSDSAGMKTMERVKARRKELGMSAEDLANLCTQQGFPMKRSTLANLESGRRQDLSIGELVAFARALRTTPVDSLEAPPCPHCGDDPPVGYICMSCGIAGSPRG